jgi:hypothetical protein
MLERARFGIDIGRVLMAASDVDGTADTSFLRGREAEALATPPSHGAFAVVAELVERTGGQVWLVSKAGPRIQELTRRWLVHQRFFALTGMGYDHLHFCLQRHEKADLARELELTHFVDDRLDVLLHLRGVVGRLYLFGHQRRGNDAPRWVTPVADWQTLAGALSLRSGLVGEDEVAGGDVIGQPDAVGAAEEEVAMRRHRVRTHLQQERRSSSISHLGRGRFGGR